MFLRFLSRCTVGVISAVVLPAVAASPAASRELKVCAEPNNMPFSNDKAEGFENRISQLIATELGATVKFVWQPEWRGFVRKGLKAGLCDVIPGVPANFGQVRTTRPYYTASYAFVQSPDAKPITAFDDAKLRDARIGVQLVGDDGANTPPMTRAGTTRHHAQYSRLHGLWGLVEVGSAVADRRRCRTP